MKDLVSQAAIKKFHQNGGNETYFTAASATTKNTDTGITAQKMSKHIWNCLFMPDTVRNPVCKVSYDSEKGITFEIYFWCFEDLFEKRIC